MKALLSRLPGGPETLTLEDLPEPVAAPGRVVVQVKACGVNFPDTLLIEDRYQARPDRPFAPGGEIAGVVTALGEGVAGLSVGDRVLSLPLWGGMVERMSLPADGVFPIPDSMPFDEAAAFLGGFGTSYHALKDRAAIRPGETLLILGAAGGVGMAAIALGKAMGARVIAAASTAERADLCLAQGADAGLVYGRETPDPKDLARRIKEACGPNGADVVYDAIGGAYAEPALRAMAWEGRYLVVGFAAGDIPRVPLNLPLLKGCSIVGVFWGPWVERNPQGHRDNLAALFALYEAGRIRPFISERFPLNEGGEALRRLGARQAAGKIVVQMP